MSSSVRFFLSPRALGMAALLAASVIGQRADAMSPINPGGGTTHVMSNGMTIEVRGGHGGGGGGGGRGAGGWGGHSFGGFSAGGASRSFVRGGAIGATAPSVAAPVPGPGVAHFAGHGFVHRHHHFGRVFVGGVYYDDYPYDDSDYTYDEPAYTVYPAPAFVAGGGCYRVLTVHGPRVVCHHRAKRHAHRVHRRLHHRRHHRA
ncbi:MAG TPA: hypothetical protein VFL62_08055 [Bradyrhizobium sp.]|uniref:hypothetical protein n=1 Tax=Bradyrhizobium sp. TaxID=376 RepID=UPI002D800C64|nr:hypothetical protein [Bradyrhizobium sp.]HET7886161.1 hypothetical protein [Bradyrhizobium sp.]